MTRKLLVGAIAAGALAVTAGTAFALTGGDDNPSTPTAVASTTSFSEPTSTTSSDDNPTSSLAPTPSTDDTPSSTASTPAPSGTALSANDAARVVQARYGGTVREVEREVEHGRVEWKVDIVTADGRRIDVRIDAQSGAVTRVEGDDRGDDRGGRGGDDDRGGDDHGGRHSGDDHGGDDRGGDDHGGNSGHGGGDDH